MVKIFFKHIYIYVSVCISYHGLGVWFPDMIKYMQYEEYESKVRVFHRERVERFHFNFSLVNQIHREGEYVHDKYVPTLPLCYCVSASH